MTQPVTSSSATAKYSLPVCMPPKTPYAVFEYSATTTIQTLNQWIEENSGAPIEKQELYVQYTSVNVWKKREFDADPNELVINRFKKVESLILKLR